MRQIAVVLGDHPTIVQNNIALLVKALDRAKFPVIEAMAVTAVTILRDTDLLAGRNWQDARRIDVEGRSATALAQPQQIPASLGPSHEQIVLFPARHPDLFASAKAGNVLMKLNHQAGQVLAGVGPLRFRPS